MIPDNKIVKTKIDFIRVIGCDVVFYLSEAVEGKVEYRGKVKEALDEEVIVDTDSGSITVPLNIINKAIQAI